MKKSRKAFTSSLIFKLFMLFLVYQFFTNATLNVTFNGKDTKPAKDIWQRLHETGEKIVPVVKVGKTLAGLF